MRLLPKENNQIEVKLTKKYVILLVVIVTYGVVLNSLIGILLPEVICGVH